MVVPLIQMRLMDSQQPAIKIGVTHDGHALFYFLESFTTTSQRAVCGNMSTD